MFRTLHPLTSGHLNTSAPLPVSSQTIPSSLPPKELTNRKVHNGIHQHRSTGSNKKGIYIALHYIAGISVSNVELFRKHAYSLVKHCMVPFSLSHHNATVHISPSFS
jgi:hypothetical protein